MLCKRVGINYLNYNKVSVGISFKSKLTRIFSLETTVNFSSTEGIVTNFLYAKDVVLGNYYTNFIKWPENGHIIKMSHYM